MDFRPGHNVLPILPNPDMALSPVAGLAWNEDQPRGIGLHSHHRGQITSVTKGAATIGTRSAVWVVSPNRAIWIPPGTEHWVRYSHTLSSRSLFTDAAISSGFPDHCTVLDIDPLSREFLNTAVYLSWNLDANHSEMRLAQLLLERIPKLTQPWLRVPEGKDKRVRRVMQGLREAPEDNRTLRQWGNLVGASDRTLARRFVQDTGLSFSEWRRQHRLMVALEQLASGLPVSSVAGNIGYENAGNFSTMFRRVFQRPPSSFFGPSLPI